MRKQQETILKRAKKSEMTQAQIDVLSREDVQIQFLNIAYNYFFNQNRNSIDPDSTAKEANKWLDFILEKQEAGYTFTSKQWTIVLMRLLPHTRNIVDTLIGDITKNKIWTAYRFVEKYIDMYDTIKLSDAYTTLILYSDMLYAKIPTKHIKDLIRTITIGKSNPHDIMYTFQSFPCMLDDLRFNGKESLIWLLSDKSIANMFTPTAKDLENLYDKANHRFVFKNSEFNKYFSTSAGYFRGYYDIDKFAIAHSKKDSYPLVTYVAKFCERYILKRNRYNDDKVFNNWTYEALFNENDLPNLRQCLEILKRPFSIHVPAWQIIVNISTDFFINITYKEFNKIHVDQNLRNSWGADSLNAKTTSLMIAPDGYIFRKHPQAGKKDKIIPLSMRDFIYLSQKPNVFGDLLTSIIKFHQKTNQFFKDVLNDFTNVECLMPISFNDLFNCYNKSHFLKTKYKLANDLKVNWNKQNLNLSYLIIKSYSWIEPGVGREIILQQKDIELIPQDTYRQKADENIKQFLTNVICANIVHGETAANRKSLDLVKKHKEELESCVKTHLLEGEEFEWVEEKVFDNLNVPNLRRSIYDYINMCRQNKKKIKIDIRSVRQLANMHDVVAVDRISYKRGTAPVKVPKKSKFNQLRELLPEEFEWIKTKKRLIIETELQHHCVWSYANKITKDLCAIYSYVDKDAVYSDDNKAKRYTIEFVVDRKGNYKIEQVQGRYDREHTSKMESYINSILEKQNKETES